MADLQNKHVIEILQSAGLSEAQITTLHETGDDEDIAVEDYSTHITQFHRNTLLADNEFLGSIEFNSLPEAKRKEIEGSQYGRFMNEFRGIATAQGVDISQFDEGTQKSLKAFANKTFAIINDKNKGKKATPDEKDAAIAELTTKLQQAVEKQGSMTPEGQERIDGLTGQVGKLTALAQQSSRNKSLRDFGQGQWVVKDPSVVGTGLHAALNLKYTLKYDIDNGGWMATQKTNSALPVLDATTSQPLSYTDLLKAEAIAQGLFTAGKVDEKKPEEKKPAEKVKVKVDGGSGDGDFSVPNYDHLG